MALDEIGGIGAFKASPTGVKPLPLEGQHAERSQDRHDLAARGLYDTTK